ncbi:helix-turn-helix domain-containing protein [Sinosporangium siamense]|uniref:helix-turn-helix domain-containing protein n=1 Tax=Sinosporangium siamense TaxID=1367973 RepID=UPI00195218EE|nr:helix-turn-helix domain-containing protein [Sinosporangium siamense]
MIGHDLAFVTREAGGREPLIVELVHASATRRLMSLKAVGRTRGAASDPGRELFERAGFAARPVFRTDPPAMRSWEELGAWTLLRGREWSLETVRELSPGAAELAREPEGMLARTWLAYLDCNRDAPRTRARLHIHRATLYHRLGRIRERAGDEVIGDGWATSSAHLALRLWAAHANGATR